MFYIKLELFLAQFAQHMLQHSDIEPILAAEIQCRAKLPKS